MYGYVKREDVERLERVAQLTAAIAAAEAERDQLVVEMRRPTMGRYCDYDAPSWAEVGQALGLTKQAAQRKYAPIIAAAVETRAAAKWAGSRSSG